MYNSMLEEFDEDPFFSDPFRAHREHMRRMMRSFSEPFGSHFSTRITDGRNRGRDVAELPRPSFDRRNERRDMSQSLLPFGSTGSTDMMQNHASMFDNMMSNMRTSMEEMRRGFDVPPAANAHSFRSSSVMSFSKVGDEPPKVFQATTSTHCAPGGIKETRQAVKDSESGLEKMKIGHQIKDRRHVVEKRHNRQTGEKEFKQDFVNMDESEADSFDSEWQQKVSRLLSPVHMPGPMQRQLGSPEHPRRGHLKRKAGRQGSGNTNEYEY
ncbi:PREDICTED: myeloid leukemia factor 1 isoform X1 [Poecilia mexicana]|uniref:Myeloid leukemia factor 1 n=2 Tax=Poecilia TaxID=8080 RepID=A0A087XGK7_POEFO|nr:PREDICTED: myeloid leukemia factor 1 isoform X1 [Poecilia formosa]XP_014846170.1 PREDICTED: myeloid leukemia factor 1 isoform X1 [Poecilia mexicana]